MESKLYDLELKPSKFINPISIFPRYENSDTYHVFLIHTEEEFIKAIWYMVKRYGVRPKGCGGWQQDNEYALRKFFKNKEYRWYAEGVTEFSGEDKYIMQYDHDEDSKIHIISLSVVEDNYKRFMEQFDDNYRDESPYVRLY